MIIDYKILESSGLISLEKSVKKHIFQDKRWDIEGNIFAYNGKFYQVIVMRDKELMDI